MRQFSIIVATDRNRGIGFKSQLPWPKLEADMKQFRVKTSAANTGRRNAVIMGRNTWESIPEKFRPLSKRLNIIVTSSQELKERYQSSESDVIVVPSLRAALTLLSSEGMKEEIERVFVIGGQMLYEEAIHSKYCRDIIVTEIEETFDCDRFFPVIDSKLYPVARPEDIRAQEHGFWYGVRVYERAPPQHEELQYLNLIKEIIIDGDDKSDRTGVGTYSKFGCQMRFSLRDGQFPLLTTKRVFWRGVAEELLWFVSGSTNGKLLQDRDIHIWDGNGSRQFLDSIGLHHREEMDLGPVYGWQWRHWGAKYVDMHTDYTGQGFDQLKDCINKIKNKPDDRRIIMSAWNPSDLNQMALPPCHMMCQFYVSNGELSCQMYQRSCDMGLGVPFNIASYSLLTCMIAKVCNLKPGEFVHSLGDAHVYKNHVQALQEQLKREPYPFPILKIVRDVQDIDDFKFEDFQIIDYKCHKPIKMEMAV